MSKVIIEKNFIGRTTPDDIVLKQDSKYVIIFGFEISTSQKVNPRNSTYQPFNLERKTFIHLKEAISARWEILIWLQIFRANSLRSFAVLGLEVPQSLTSTISLPINLKSFRYNLSSLNTTSHQLTIPAQPHSYGNLMLR